MIRRTFSKIFMKTPTVLALLVGCIFVSLSLAKDLKLTIVHTNDVHSRFLQTNKYSGPCSKAEAAKNACFGGFSRLHYKVSEIRRKNPNVLYLSAGDYFQGTIWYTLSRWSLVSRFVNILNHTTMALGNHEFDDNLDGLIPFLDAATFPIISSNIDDSLEPKFRGKVKKSVVVSMDGVKIGIIGYTTTAAKAISKPGNLIFNDEVSSVNEEAERLHKDGIKILIAVGHAGYDVDMRIAENVPFIDLVVGGHTNTFLYSGPKPPSIEEAKGPYPTMVKQNGGKKVPVVQAYAYGKYLGYLNVTFDENGDLKEFQGNPILMDHTIPQDPELLETLTNIGDNLTQSLRNKIGTTHVFLNGTDLECRLRECNLGNLVTDSMVYGNMRKSANENYWLDVTIAILSGGSIRSSIDEQFKQGNITTEDLLTVLPFGNTIDIIEIKGRHILEAFEYCVEGYDVNGHHLSGKFLQVSGIQVVYDLAKPEKSRVKSLQVLCSKCRVPTYSPIDLEQIYMVAVQTYLAGGGDGFQVIKNNILKKIETGSLDTDLLLDFIKSRSPIVQGIEGRIRFHEKSATYIPNPNSNAEVRATTKKPKGKDQGPRQKTKAPPRGRDKPLKKISKS